MRYLTVRKKAHKRKVNTKKTGIRKSCSTKIAFHSGRHLWRQYRDLKGGKMKKVKVKNTCGPCFDGC